MKVQENVFCENFFAFNTNMKVQEINFLILSSNKANSTHHYINPYKNDLCVFVRYIYICFIVSKSSCD